MAIVRLEDIYEPTLRSLVKTLRGQSVALLRWSYIWYDDQGDPYEVCAYDHQGREVNLDDYNDVERMAGYVCDGYGDFELVVANAQVNVLRNDDEHDDYRVPPGHGGDSRDDSDVWVSLQEADVELECNVCGDVFPAERMNTCTCCGDQVCDNHYYGDSMLCVECEEGDGE